MSKKLRFVKVIWKRDKKRQILFLFIDHLPKLGMFVIPIYKNLSETLIRKAYGYLDPDRANGRINIKQFIRVVKQIFN